MGYSTDYYAEIRRRVAVQVRLLRHARSLTQEALAENAGLATRQIQKIEVGQANLTLETLAKLAGALEVDVIDILAKGGDRASL